MKTTKRDGFHEEVATILDDILQRPSSKNTNFTDKSPFVTGVYLWTSGRRDDRRSKYVFVTNLSEVVAVVEWQCSGAVFS